MFLLYCLFLIDYQRVDYFPGNWTATFINDEEKEFNESAHFYLYIEKEPINQSGLIMQSAFGSFRNSTNMQNLPPANKTFLILPHEDEEDHFLLLHIDFPLPLSLEGYFNLLNDVSDNYSVSLTNNFEELVESLEFYLEENFNNSRVFAFDSYYLNETNQTHAFALNKSFTGTLISNYFKNLSIFDFQYIGSLFDYKGYIIEAKIFGVLSGLTAVICGYAWKSLLNRFTSDVYLQHLSMTAILMHVGTDFGYSLLMLELGLANMHYIYLYVTIFLAYITVYFVFQMRLLVHMWRAHGYFTDRTAEALRQEFVQFFSEVTLILTLASVTVSVSLDYPWFALPYVYSYFIPQIIYSTKTGGRKTKDWPFVILITISRIIPLGYFCLYHKNINGGTSIPIFVIFSAYAIIQAIIVLLQNKFGGAFFLPKKYRPQTYNYFAYHVPPGTECSICMTPIEEGDETMTTPCHHSFHRQCLERWMAERMICPLDRSPLPPVSN